MTVRPSSTPRVSIRGASATGTSESCQRAGVAGDTCTSLPCSRRCRGVLEGTHGQNPTSGSGLRLLAAQLKNTFKHGTECSVVVPHGWDATTGAANGQTSLGQRSTCTCQANRVKPSQVRKKNGSSHVMSLSRPLSRPSHDKPSHAKPRQAKPRQGRASQVKSSQVRSGQVRSGQVRSGQVRSGQVRSGQVRSGQVRSGQVRSGQVRSGQVRSGQVKSSQVKLSQVKSNHVTSRHVKSSQVKSSQVKSSQVKSSQVKSSQVKSSQVKSSQVKSSQVISEACTRNVWNAGHGHLRGGTLPRRDLCLSCVTRWPTASAQQIQTGLHWPPPRAAKR